ncbi:spore protease YyaC [Clostridium sp. HCP1S3_B4]|uniref:spore protease YyaC n=1 Tax=unclassified Clostridium TaxID=2614128 RepID=UPI001699B1B6|nr:spore protease YyaC [Clostridium sp.]NLK23832.1 spore protease YyaC [Clostridiales bacterium]
MIKQKVKYNSPMAYYQIAKSIKKFITKNTVIICIGTDKCIGDCLGPLVGTLLKESFLPLPVYGTISSPIHALNLDNNLRDITLKHPDSCIIGIDACLGNVKSVGEIHTRDYPIHPGKGVGKKLTDVGTASIIGIVDSSDYSNIFSARSIRLSFISDMAKVISHGILEAYSNYQNNFIE